MEFRILGPLEVSDGGSEVSLGGPKLRSLLALLLLHGNEVVSADRLIDELWGDDVPERATAALRVNVSRLRKALPEGVLSTRSPGYVIRVGPDELDLHRFERLVEEGRGLVAGGRVADASKRLHDACRRCGEGRRSPTSPTRTSPGRPSPGSGRSGWQRSSCESTPISFSGAIVSWSGNSVRWSPSTRSANACGGIS